MPKTWKPTLRSARLAKVGDAIRNPVCQRQSSSKAVRDRAYALADQMDAILDKRGLKIDNTALCVGFVERK